VESVLSIVVIDGVRCSTEYRGTQIDLESSPDKSRLHPALALVPTCHRAGEAEEMTYDPESGREFFD
jgi:hypothetical protein